MKYRVQSHSTQYTRTNECGDTVTSTSTPSLQRLPSKSSQSSEGRRLFVRCRPTVRIARSLSVGRSFVHPFVRSFVSWLVGSFVGLFIRGLICPFVRRVSDVRTCFYTSCFSFARLIAASLCRRGDAHTGELLELSERGKLSCSNYGNT